MLAYVLTIMVMVSGSPAKIYHVSQERFGARYHGKCLEQARLAADKMYRRFNHFAKKPEIRIRLECDEQVTFEA